MTTIAANREGMASDSQATGGGVKTSVQKFWRIRGWLVGAAGQYSEIIETIDELKHHKELSPAEVFRRVSVKAKSSDFLLLSPSGQLWMSEEGKSPWRVQEGFAAIGSGQQGAMVALHLGSTPQEAIKAVRKVDPYTGGRVITRKL